MNAAKSMQIEALYLANLRNGEVVKAALIMAELPQTPAVVDALKRSYKRRDASIAKMKQLEESVCCCNICSSNDRQRKELSGRIAAEETGIQIYTARLRRMGNGEGFSV